MIIRDLEYRNKFRTLILSKYTINNGEVFAFHPMLDNYLISNTGKVKSLITGKILKTFKNSNNYDAVNVKFVHKGRRCTFVHRLVAETFLSYLGIDNYVYETNHINGNKNNNSLDNIEWLTRQENLEHSRQMRLSKSFKNEQNGNHKLTNNDVLDIIELYSLGFNALNIAKSYKCSRSHISNIINKKVRVI